MRYIYQRVKSPIVKFNKKREVFKDSQLEDIIQVYVEFAEELNKYQMQKFRLWIKKVDDEASEFLKNNILAKDEVTGMYKVNFKNDFRILIAEAKYIDRMIPTSEKKKSSML